MKCSGGKRALSLFLTAATMLLFAFSSAETSESDPGWIRPKAVVRDEGGTPDGQYRIGIEDAGHLEEGWFTLSLYLEDLYDRGEIAGMKPGDRVTVHGETYTAAMILIHGYIDTDGDGETDRSTVLIRNAEEFRDQAEANELAVDGDYENAPESFVLSAYELIPAEEMYGYIAFEPVSEDACRAVRDDWSPCSYVRSVKIQLPLPEDFVLEDYMGEESGAEDFLNDLSGAGYSPYNTRAWFADGRLMKVSHSDYPAGPEESD